MKRLPRSALLRLAGAALGAAGLLLGGCATAPPGNAGGPGGLMPSVRAALQTSPDKEGARASSARPAGDSPAAAPPASLAAAAREDQPLPLPAGRAERRFSVVLNNATPEVLFMALLAETPLSVAVDPAVKGPISITLKDVTLRESLDLLRELHGLEYKVIGRHILVSPAQLQTRIFTVDYPSFNRNGRSELRVLSGSITGSTPVSTPGSGGQNPNNSAGATGGASSGGASQESSRISTAQRNDLWGEIETTVKLLIGEKEGRSVVVSPQTGNIVVRALPREIRAISDYLEATRVSVQRQVMLEAKVVEVQLRDSERTGINWAAFKLGLGTRGAAGMISPGASLSNSSTVGDGLITFNPQGALEAAATASGSLLGLAFQTRNFAAVLDFLGTQGNTQVLSSPRIATMNNQKAVLKVGTDDFFVTSISSTTTAVGNTTATTPNIGVQPFFSGISLDVTPNIDAQGFITLHVHPSVSTVSERTKVINLGAQGSYALPLASSEINESDAVVRAQDGNIIAIGGLMRQTSVNSDSGVPGTEGSGFFRKLLGGQTNKLSEKRELVILLKPTIVDPSQEDAEVRRDALQRLLDWTESQPPVKSGPAPRAAAEVPPPAAAPAATSTSQVTGRLLDSSAVPRASVVVPMPMALAASPAPATPAAPPAHTAQAAATPTAPPPVLSWSAMALALGESTAGLTGAPPAAPRAPAAAAAPLPTLAPIASIAPVKALAVRKAAEAAPTPRAITTPTLVSTPAPATPPVAITVAAVASQATTPPAPARRPLPALPPPSPLQAPPPAPAQALPAELGLPRSQVIPAANWFRPVQRREAPPGASLRVGQLIGPTDTPRTRLPEQPGAPPWRLSS